MRTRDVLARNLRLYRQRAGISQEALADKADLDRTYISSIERGVYAATVDTLERLAIALGIDPAELLGDGPEERVERN